MLPQKSLKLRGSECYLMHSLGYISWLKKVNSNFYPTKAVLEGSAMCVFPKLLFAGLPVLCTDTKTHNGA